MEKVSDIFNRLQTKEHICDTRKTTTHYPKPVSEIVPATITAPQPEPVRISKRQLQRANRLVAIREDREHGKLQHLGYLARPFVLCGLPFKKPKAGAAYYKRQNGNEVLEIVAHPEHGLPFGMDIEVLIWTCILAKEAMIQNGNRCPEVLEFKSGADFLRTFGLPLDGASYRRAMARFMRVFYATWFWGPVNPTKTRPKVQAFRFFERINLSFDGELDAPAPPGEKFQTNQLFLSRQLQLEMERALPVIEMETLKEWANNPTQVYFNIWLAWRCHDANAGTRIPLTGPNGVQEQCGFEGYDGPDGGRNFRKKIVKMLKAAKVSWPDCPVHLLTNEPPALDYLVIERAGSPIRKS
jgi:hypothetical protein